MMYDDSWKQVPCKPTRRALDTHGYGSMQVNGEQTASHRAAYEQFYNIDLPRGVLVLHKCDNRACEEIAHLFAGSAYDNWKDAVNKGRVTVTGKKLTADDVFEIRVWLATGRYGLESLARRYSVNKSTIREIRDYKIWKRVKIF